MDFLLLSILKDPARLALFRDALSLLYQAGVYPLMMELSARNAITPKVLEAHALQNARREGYTLAVEDLFGFFEKYTAEHPRPVMPPADFGAMKELLSAGDITEKEIQEFYGRS